MPRERSETVHLWYTAVYEAIQEIPEGRVTSYSHIAKLLGKPERRRQVGICLKHLPSQEGSSEYHDGNVPWQRVINAKGEISPRGPHGATRQAAALRREHVDVDQDSMGVFSVDFSKYGWFPDILPSEEFDDSDDTENELEDAGVAA
ncbi:putative 6-O-methylguanine DNA methyltransferase [Pseudovirgaria hyperparasitica]|uniref:Putative 6-O-methylguanine DNA methyltransferase n=1 Tax=Pseudovirgaria hyperparasitica TaxID=470096 RepID=A0A6A6WEQ4_9PEZI|nr:putative 6-O-methylguanine DNA methyltransferase [Pseudovirgaria hyperparasitica]KAF2761302.1 putative 6-O-methylguanine DNA methyltransferase [Pseudovirgaria hyperparasitica]